MQHRYVGDVGDYVKLAILRELSIGKSLGVAWWLHPDENHNNDGGHREYLKRPKEWRSFDPDLFDYLRDNEQKRNISVLENPVILPKATFARDFVPCGEWPCARRSEKREQWLQQIKCQFEDCGLIFLDPDNGIASEKVKLTHKRAGKCVLIPELGVLRRTGRPMIIYHQHTRFKGSHRAEIGFITRRLVIYGFEVSGVLRAKNWAPRVFFILDGNSQLCHRARQVEEKSDGKIELFSGDALAQL